MNLKSTLKLESPNLVPGGINFTVINNETLANSSMSTRTLTQTPTSLTFNGQAGPKGAMVYLQAPASNPGFVNVLDENNQPTLTLKPGEFALMPLTGNGSVSLNCSFGTCSVNYIYADKGGDFGKMTIILSPHNGNWHYSVLDYEYGQAKQLIDLGISDELLYYGWTAVDGKGMVLNFENTNYKLINPRGELLESPSTSVSWSTYSLDGKGYVWWAPTNVGEYTVILFDGEASYRHVFSNTMDLWIDSNWDYCTADGAIVAYSVTADTETNITSLIKKDSVHELASIQYDDALRYVDSYVYYYGTYVLLLEYSDDTSTYTKMEIWDTNGVKLKSVNLESLNLTDISRQFYGKGKLQLVGYDSTDAGTPYYLFNFNEATNTLIGEDLSVSHQRGSDFINHTIFAQIRSRWASSQLEPNSAYEPESVMVAFFDDGESNSNSYFLKREVYWLDVMTLFDGDSQFYSRNLASGSMGAFNLRANWAWGRNGVYTSKYYIIVDSAQTRTTGVLTANIFTKGGNFRQVTVAPDMSVINPWYDDTNGDPHSLSFGDYHMYAIYNTSTNKTTYKVYNPVNTTVSQVELSGQLTYNGVWKTRHNSLFIRDWDTARSWYFNDSSKKFVQTSEFYGNVTSVRSHAFISGNDNGSLLLSWYGSNNDYFRVLGSNRFSKKLSIPYFNQEPYYYEVSLGLDKVLWVYTEDGTRTIKAKIYDYELNLIKTHTVGTLASGWEFVDRTERSGDQFLIRIYDGVSAWKYYYITDETVELVSILESDHPNARTFVNDTVWAD